MTTRTAAPPETPATGPGDSAASTTTAALPALRALLERCRLGEVQHRDDARVRRARQPLGLSACDAAPPVPVDTLTAPFRPG